MTCFFIWRCNWFNRPLYNTTVYSVVPGLR